MEYEWIVYKTTNIINLHEYIGVHHSPIGKDDGYIGNDIYCDHDALRKNHVFHRAVRKYGYKNFSREILFTYPNTIDGKKQAFRKEAELVNREYLKRKDVYNMVIGGRVPSSINEKEVAQYDLDGKFIQFYYSMAYASSITGESKKGISHCCTKNTYYGNYQWRYYTGNCKNIDPVQTIYKTVYQFDLNGNYITYYRSCIDAAKAIRPNNKRAESSISAVCRGEQGQAFGYYWNYKKQFDFNKLHSDKDIAVACYDDNGTFIKSYTSLRQAEKDIHTTRKTISNCIKGKSKKAGKLRWRIFNGDTSNIAPL